MASRLERPSFFEGQFLGAADLAALVTYARDLGREHALAAHTWGIAIGLELVEIPSEEPGAVDLFVMPGFAWDGYGRAIVVLSPAQVPLEEFSGLPSGNQQVWIRYDETPFRGLREGFETCGAEEAFARVRESFAIEVGPFARVRDRQGGITLAGQAVEDARLAARSFSDTAPLMCDGSVPHQEFPEDRARWLVPLGVGNWADGAPGRLQPRTAEALKLGRTLRHLAGAVAENLFAADGVIRLRDRFTQFKAGDAADTLCQADRITVEDLINEPDRDDSTKTTDRLVGRELVWVEGNLRATGQVRLFGTRLELRDTAGEEAADVPLYARRAVSPNNPAAGQDFQIVIGSASDGKDRLAVGPAVDYGDLEERFLVRTDGVLAAGLDLPDDLKTDHVLFSRGDALTVALATNADATARIAFQTLPALGEAAQIAYDDAENRLQVSVGSDLANATTFTSTGHVGIRMDDPITLHADANDLVVQNPSANVGMTLLSDDTSSANIHFADGLAGPAENRAGFIRYAHSNDRLHFGTANAVRATIDSQGDLGIGTEAPAARIDIREAGSGRALKLDADSLRAEDGGAATRLELQPNGGGLRVHGSTTASNRVAITSSGQVGIGTDAPSSSLHVARSTPELTLDVTGGGAAARVEFAVSSGVRSTVEYDVSSQRTLLTNDGDVGVTLRQNRVGINLGAASPSNHLHVRGNISGDAGNTANHVALVENLAGANADVLALRVGGGGAAGSNNFITFFDSSGAIGRIERSTTAAGDNPVDAGNFLRLLSGGADFAECLPRAEAATAIGPGRIIGVRSGRVSLVTEDAESLLVTTDRAVVVGNVPMSGDSGQETVALVGQVKLHVSGQVRSGDFIVPSGRNDGEGRAVPLAALTPALAGQVVGRAWQDRDGTDARPVTVAVGIQGADALAALSAALASQERRIGELTDALRALVGAADHRES